MRKTLIMIASLAVALLVVIGGRYAYWATSATEPYDEIGIGLHAYMPSAVQAWACARLQGRFASNLPPAGCQDAGDQRKWRQF
jgi:hypothetical protein